MTQYTHIDPAQCEYYSIGSEDDLPDGKRLFIEIDNIPIVIFRVGGQLYAISDACSHDDGPLGDGDLEGTHIICPRHGARFDIVTGKALSLPAVVDILAYPVRVNNHQIEVGFPKTK